MNLVSHQGWWTSQDWSYRKNNVVYLHVFFFLLSLLYQNKEDVLRGAIYRINKICWFPIVAASPGPTQALGKKRNNWHTSAPRYLWREYLFFQVVIVDFHILIKYLTNSRLYHCDLHKWTAQKEISQILWSKLSDWENMNMIWHTNHWTIGLSTVRRKSLMNSICLLLLPLQLHQDSCLASTVWWLLQGFCASLISKLGNNALRSRKDCWRRAQFENSIFGQFNFKSLHSLVSLRVYFGFRKVCWQTIFSWPNPKTDPSVTLSQTHRLTLNSLSTLP